MRTTFSPRAEIDYYPITASLPYHACKLWLNPLVANAKYRIARGNDPPIDDDPLPETADRRGRAYNVRRRTRESERESTITGVRYVKYARSTIPIFRPDRISKRGWGTTKPRSVTHSLAPISCGRARVRISPGSSEYVEAFTLAWPLARRLAKLETLRNSTIDG